MPRHESKAVTNINAPPEKVWSIWMDFDKLSEWSPYYKEISFPKNDDSGEVEKKVGAKIHLEILLPGKDKPMPAEPEVITLDDENMKLEWTASMMCLYKIFHSFTVESDGNGGSIFTDFEVVTGLMVPMMGSMWDPMDKGMKNFGEELKKRCEE